MSKRQTINRKLFNVSRGFSLVEMAIVLTIVALLMAGLLPLLSGQVEQGRRTETRKLMNEIQQALIGYAIINGRFPYPACGTIAANANYAGVEISPASSATCASGSSDIAVLPWATLGINETDGWGRRFSYSVTDGFADAASGTGATSCTTSADVSFQICSEGTLYVKDAGAVNTIANKVPVVVVSHGGNGCGAYTPNGGNKIAIAVGDSSGNDCSNAGGDQNENADGSANTTLISRDFSPNFDDLILWISPNALVNRMVAAGKLP